jgi:hypothetical protein
MVSVRIAVGERLSFEVSLESSGTRIFLALFLTLAAKSIFHANVQLFFFFSRDPDFEECPIRVLSCCT